MSLIKTAEYFSQNREKLALTSCKKINAKTGAMQYQACIVLTAPSLNLYLPIAPQAANYIWAKETFIAPDEPKTAHLAMLAG